MLYPVNRKEIKLLFSSSQPHLREASGTISQTHGSFENNLLIKKKNVETELLNKLLEEYNFDA